METNNMITEEKKIPAWLARLRVHPLLVYIFLVLAWSWGIWSCLFLVIKPGGIVHNPPPAALALAGVGAFGPTVASLLATAIIYGRQGFKNLLARLGQWRVGKNWLALLIIPFFTGLTPLARWLAGYSVEPAAMLANLIPGIMLGLFAGTFEEIGWRGFMLPHLLKKYSPLAATLLLGLFWGGIWHGYADFFGLGDKGWAALILIILLGPGLLTAWSLIITRVFQRTQGSLLMSILMHATISSSALIFGQSYSSISEEILWTTISVIFAWIAAALVWFLLKEKKA